MKSDRKIIFTVTKEEYDIVSNFLAFLDNLDREVYDDVREVICDYDNDFYDMVSALHESISHPKESNPMLITEAIQTIADYCDKTDDCTICPLNKKCRFMYPYTWKETSQS